MRLRQLFEAPRTAVMAFGRMNPPTIGHAKLVDKIKSLPGDPYVFLSQSQKPKTDPLAFQDKLRYAKFFFPDITIGNPEVRTIIQALQKINELGYKNLIYVAGSDRVQAFEEMINKYNGVEYNFDNIQVVSAGERDPDADGAEGMSASKMRAAAAAGDLESFKQGVPNQEVADEMFAAVRQGMGIKDAVPAEGVAEGLFGLSAKEKAKIQYVTAKISDIPGNWDHANQRYTEQGLKDLKSVMKNEKYLKYALSLTADDYEAEDASEDEEDEFHRKLDKLVHKTFGHSSDEKKMKKVKEANYGRYWCSTDKKWKNRKGPKQSRSS